MKKFLLLASCAIVAFGAFTISTSHSGGYRLMPEAVATTPFNAKATLIYKALEEKIAAIADSDTKKRGEFLLEKIANDYKDNPENFKKYTDRLMNIILTYQNNPANLKDHLTSFPEKPAPSANDIEAKKKKYFEKLQKENFNTKDCKEPKGSSKSAKKWQAEVKKLNADFKKDNVSLEDYQKKADALFASYTKQKCSADEKDTQEEKDRKECEADGKNYYDSKTKECTPKNQEQYCYPDGNGGVECTTDPEKAKEEQKKQEQQQQGGGGGGGQGKGMEALKKAMEGGGGGGNQNSGNQNSGNQNSGNQTSSENASEKATNDKTGSTSKGESCDEDTKADGGPEHIVKTCSGVEANLRKSVEESCKKDDPQYKTKKPNERKGDDCKKQSKRAAGALKKAAEHANDEQRKEICKTLKEEYAEECPSKKKQCYTSAYQNGSRQAGAKVDEGQSCPPGQTDQKEGDAAPAATPSTPGNGGVTADPNFDQSGQI